MQAHCCKNFTKITTKSLILQSSNHKITVIFMKEGNFMNDLEEFRFSEKGLKSLPKFTSKNLKNIRLELRMGVLLGVISDIHRVLWVSADPVDVRNDSQ